MSTVKLTMKRGKRKLPSLARLEKRVKELNKQKAMVGYFKDQVDEHPNAKMNYASLAFIHANGHEFGYPVRNIFTHFKPTIAKNPKQTRMIKGLLKGAFSSPNISAKIVLDTIGKTYHKMGTSIFGNTTYLVETANPTPLIDDGYLRKNFGYRTTINYRLVTN
ncbi:hypothetical protein [Pseudoalteromonas phage J2-1_QLiu-2017]|nr:hypothetical protein [Pseudoalteromonas phage J2-1_QLiu-2017]